MVALFREGAELDPSKKAGDVLEYVLNETSEKVFVQNEHVSTTKEELKKDSILESVSSRTKSRVLFITDDILVLKEGSLMQSHFKNIASTFEEVHVIVLTTIYQAKKGVVRLDTNLWLYSTSVRYSLLQVFSALNIAEHELQFASGFRPDVVVALDPWMSGLVGMEIAEKYGRTFQLHVREDVFSEYAKVTYGKMYGYIARFVLKRSMSIRTTTEHLREKFVKMCSYTKDIQLLPKFVDIEALVASSKTEIQEEDAFPQFSFVILFVGALDYESTLFRAIDAARTALFSKGIGLVVLGDGPSKKEFQTRAKLLGVEEQVLFTSDTGMLPRYLECADVLLCTDTTDVSDEVVVKAAACGLPIITAENHFRSDLFTDGTDAFLCPKEDTVCFSQKLIKFLNSNALRTQFSQNAREIVSTRLSQDPEVYKQAYRDSIESVFDGNRSSKGL